MGFQVLIYLIFLLQFDYTKTQSAIHRESYKVKVERSGATCRTEDLNHSILVECNRFGCKNGSDIQDFSWPKDSSQVIHILSSRSGERFALNSYQNLNLQENEQERLLNINTTLYVKTNTNTKQIYGFGTTLTPTNVPTSPNKNDLLSTNLFPIMKEMFGSSTRSLGLTLMRIRIGSEDVRSRNISSLMETIDALAVQARASDVDKIKVIMSLEDLEDTSEMVEALKSVSHSLSDLKILELWALSLNRDWLLEAVHNEEILKYLQDINATSGIFSITNTRSAPDIVNLINRYHKEVFSGILIKSEYSIPYDTLENVNMNRGGLKLISIGRERALTSTYGDWQNAQDYAVEILKHLSFGSNGFIEENSFTDILTTMTPIDCSIYSLYESHDVHFRGPMFYAIGHFSRYLKPKSRLLAQEIFTQPNMFAANYVSFVTEQNEIVAIVLNDNEHILPFRLAVDDKIVVVINIPPKSFNTIILKQ